VRRVGIGLGLVVSLIGLVVLSSISFGVADEPTQSASSALETLVAYGNQGEELKATEARPDTLVLQSESVVQEGGAKYLLIGAEGTNALGVGRAVFAVFEVDPDTGEWRPRHSVESDMRESQSVTATVLELPNGSMYLGYIGTSDTPVSYLTKAGDEALLSDESVGFVRLPGDADPSLSLSQ
jgi:hypothetical protein